MKDLLIFIKKIVFIMEGYVLFFLVLGGIELITRYERLGDPLWRMIEPNLRWLIICPVVALIISSILTIGKKYTFLEGLVAIISSVILEFFAVKYIMTIPV